MYESSPQELQGVPVLGVGWGAAYTDAVPLLRNGAVRAQPWRFGALALATF